MAWDGPILTDSGGFQVFSLREPPHARRRRRHVPLASRRQRASFHARERDRVPGGDRRATSRWCWTSASSCPLRVEELAESVRLTTRVGAALARRARRASATARLRDRAGRPRRRAARAQRARTRGTRTSPVTRSAASRSARRARRCTHRAARTAALLPAEKPRYLMGVGTVRDLVDRVDCGIDMFDCVYPTRCGRNGRAMTRAGEFNILNAAYTSRLRAGRPRLRLLRLHDVYARVSRAPLPRPTRCSGRACSRTTTSTCSTP